MVLIAAEMLAQNPGLGKFVWDEFQNGSSDSLGRIMVVAMPALVVVEQTDVVKIGAGTMSKSFLELTQLGMRFPTPQGEFIALKNVDMQIQKGEFISLIGHSGCGKSPERAVVFQNHSLLPWLTVYQNVELAVKQIAQGQSKAWVKELRWYETAGGHCSSVGLTT